MPRYIDSHTHAQNTYDIALSMWCGSIVASINGLGVRDALHPEVVLVQVGGHKLLGDGTVETLACEIGPQGENARGAERERHCEESTSEVTGTKEGGRAPSQACACVSPSP